MLIALFLINSQDPVWYSIGSTILLIGVIAIALELILWTKGKVKDIATKNIEDQLKELEKDDS